MNETLSHVLVAIKWVLMTTNGHTNVAM